MSRLEFPAPPPVAYPGGCTLEPAPFALDALVNWRATVRVGERTYPDVRVLELLRDVLRDPGAYGVEAAAAHAARERFLELGAQVLEPLGGDRRWLEREFRR